MWFVYSILGILAFVLLIAAILSLPRFDHLIKKDRPPPGMTHRE
jgi:hypothetical protein